jgi:hypothetical protein
MLAIATEQVADDGVIEEKIACSTIIRNLDVDHAEAVEGMDLEGLEQETRELLESDS